MTLDSVSKTMLLGMLSMPLVNFSFAENAFIDCPNEAFLFQRNPVQVYGVDLLTGGYNLLQTDVGMPGNINGVGFNFSDRFIYGFNMNTYEVVKIDRNFQATALSVSGLPNSTGFYVGDVFANTYWVYRKNVGLYSIDLDETSPDYLIAQKFSQADVSLNLTDLAFNPIDDQMYVIDNNTGNVYRFNQSNGQFILLGNAGVTGTFGAAYFDVLGFFYLSRNSDGSIFRIDLSDVNTPNVTADLFAQGPNSSQNDGARCAYAPLVSNNLDWGDAPDTYKTTLSANGPRHFIKDDIYLGDRAASVNIDEDSGNITWPESDDNDQYNDDNGISWASSWVAGLHQELVVKTMGEGYLNIWIDWNANGVFDENEHVMEVSLTTGTHQLPLLVPAHASIASTWLRARYSSTPGIQSYGGANDGEVEDYPITIEQGNLSLRYFPNATGWSTLAYEDRWPLEGDYDFNDVVLKYRLRETSVDGQLSRIDIAIKIQALGAEYKSGFAVKLNDLPFGVIDRTKTIFRIDKHHQYSTEAIHSNKSIATLSKDLSKHLLVDCQFFRTNTDCQSDHLPEIELSVMLKNNPNVTLSFPYSPFIFGSENSWRGPILESFNKRSVEVHLVDHEPTSLFNENLWLKGDDDSMPANNRYFRTKRHLPWALLLTHEWLHPKEKTSLLTAYPQFKQWIESSGEQAQQWYLPENANTNFLYNGE